MGYFGFKVVIDNNFLILLQQFRNALLSPCQHNNKREGLIFAIITVIWFTRIQSAIVLRKKNSNGFLAA